MTKDYEELALNSILLKIGTQGMASALKAECTAPLVTRPAIWKLILSGKIMAFASAHHVSRQKLQLENLSPFKLKVKLQIYSYV